MASIGLSVVNNSSLSRMKRFMPSLSPKKEIGQTFTLNRQLSQSDQLMEKGNNMAEVATLIMVAKSILKSLESAITDLSHEAHKLKDPVSSINELLIAAEKILSSDGDSQHSDSERVRSWVKEVSKALYKASDLVDQATADLAAFLSKFRDRSSFDPCRSNSSIVGVRMGPEIDRICNEFNRLKQAEAAPDPSQLGPVEKYETPYELEIYAKLAMWLFLRQDTVKVNIVDTLLDASSDTDQHISVFSIFGGKSAGKSALAKLIYDDEKITNHFDLKLWVNASHKFDINQILKAIFLSCVPPSSRINAFELKQQKDLLKLAITENLLFLVLDHVADVSDENWNSLTNLLKVCARGSKILVTTRSQEVAEAIGSDKSQRLSSPNEMTLWERMKLSLPTDDKDLKSELKHISYKLLIDLPILLYVRVPQQCFQERSFRPLRRQFYNPVKLISATEILSALLRGYSSLQIPEKACFAYCSIFPAYYEIRRFDLVSLWMAQGYIVPEDSRDLEDVALEYFQTLTKRKFLKPEQTDVFGNIQTCKLHRFARDLANKVSEGWETMVHCSLISGRDESKSTRLHSFLHWISPRDNDDGAAEMLEKIPAISDIVKTPTFRSLRVLDLHSLNLPELPKSIANLIHIRYLDLSHNESLQKLPNSITNLHHLQTLKLNFCYELRELPTTFGTLVNLRRLEIDGCDKLTCMPPGFGNLSSLRILSRYVVGRPRSRSASALAALGNLNHLRERLMIELPQNWATTTDEAKKSNLRNKDKLRELKIKWVPTTRRRTKAPLILQRSLLDGLQPPIGLQKLQIEGYRGDGFPIWAVGNELSTSLSNLISVSIDGCKQSKTLPCFSQLQHLKHLSLRFMDDVIFFESSTSESRYFPSLEELTLHSFYNLERWWEDEKQSSASFTRLKKLTIWSCPRLISIPSFPQVVELDMQNINEELLKLHDDSWYSYLGLRKHPQKLHSLNNVHIRSCLHLQTLKYLESSKKLKKVVIEGLDMLDSVTEVLKQLTLLEELEIAGCKVLDLLGECQKDGCDGCRNCYAPWDKLFNLHRLTLRELPKLVEIPAGLKFVKPLRFLCISRCHYLKELPEFVSNLTSLQHLKLEGCPALKMLPEGLKEIKRLVKIDIIECPQLTERCKFGGEDWEKIKHARVLCHKSWRYALMSEAESSQKAKEQTKQVVAEKGEV